MMRFPLAFFVLIFLPIHVHSEESQLLISKIQNGWNQIQTMTGKFSQLDDNNNQQTGSFYFVKPYQSKFVYDDQLEDIITNESLLVIVDKDNVRIDSYAIGGNIIKKLLSEDLNITKEFNIDFVNQSEFTYELGARFKNQDFLSRAELTFNKDTLELEKWQIFDELGNKTVLEFTKIKKNIFISQNLFVVRNKF